jgi:ferrous iron transport protein B
VALAGNPNSGKTTLFNALTGAHHKVGNYPGVTVEKRSGFCVRGGKRYSLVDLPGIYSLTAYSLDEVVARDFILDEKPDVILDVLDSTNLERHLYLCLQFQELGIPVVAALNMSDEAEARGISVDAGTLSRTLGIPMVKTVGPKAEGLDALLAAVDEAAAAAAPGRGGRERPLHAIRYGMEIEEKLESIERMIAADAAFTQKYPTRWLAVKLLEKDRNAYERLAGHADGERIAAAARAAADWIGRHFGKDSEIIVSEQRYGYIRGALKEAITVHKKADFSLTEKADKIIMHRYLALPIFVFVLWAVFQITFLVGAYPTAALEAFFGFLGETAQRLLPEGLLRSLIVDGIIGGVGGVFSFVPLIVILFLLLSLLEDLGYMSRAAFATDKFLHSMGLHGQSVFPMMLGFGCSVPAIMAARTLKSRRDRIVTILITPLMSCGAKLPVHTLLAAAFFPRHAGNAVMLIYAVGVALSLACAFLLNKTVLRGDPTPFVMELPPYRAPTLRGLLWHVWEKTLQYVKKAGTVILGASLLIWAITTFPAYQPAEGERAALAAQYRAAHTEEDDAADAAAAAWADAEIAGKALEYSFAGRIGHAIEPVFRPLGFTWKIAVAAVTGFAAKEVIVSTLGILYRAGASGEGEDDADSAGLENALRSDEAMRPLIALSLMLFTLIIPPCFAALGAIKAELGLKWVLFEFAFLFALGWLVCLGVFQIGRLAGF